MTKEEERETLKIILGEAFDGETKKITEKDGGEDCVVVTKSMTPQPISTAPSGQRILLYCQRKATDEGWWEIGTTNSFGEWINDEFDPSLLLTQPTFWLPVPPTPTQPQ